MARNGPLTDVNLGWAGWILAQFAPTNRMAFNAAREMIVTALTDGANFADDFVGYVRQADPGSIGKSIRDDWNVFREPANRLGDDAAKLGRTTLAVLGEGTNIYVRPIRDL